ncbi:MAG TPA: two-component system response regulator KdpE [Fluviicoccus sp.]|nr:two-component system response regulator KdpE [Fluviicoccus sp.]
MTDHAPLILIVEDERQIRRFIRSALESEGCTVRENERGRPGLLDAVAVKPDLVLLDLGLPDIDGVEFIRDLRAWSTAPVIVVSARSDEREKILALDAGADDYLTKPFGVGELLARVRVLLRRRNAGHGSPFIRFGEVAVDLARRQVTRAGTDVHLTPIEYRLLTTLLASDGKVLTHRHLLREVWGPGYAESNHYLRIYMGHLRQKLEPDATRPRYFLTETGIGYRFQS